MINYKYKPGFQKDPLWFYLKYYLHSHRCPKFHPCFCLFITLFCHTSEFSSFASPEGLDSTRAVGTFWFQHNIKLMVNWERIDKNKTKNTFWSKDDEKRGHPRRWRATLTMHLQCTCINAPAMHLQSTCNEPEMHLQCTCDAPAMHLQ